MEDQIINFETAKLAHQKGFKEECHYSYSTEDDDITMEDLNEKPIINLVSAYEYNGNFLFTEEDIQCAIDNGYSQTYFAPTQSLLQKWLREKHELSVRVEPNASGWFWILEKTNGTFIEDWNYNGDDKESGMFTSYESALEQGLYETLKKKRVK